MKITAADIGLHAQAAPYRVGLASPVPAAATPAHGPEDHLSLMASAPLAAEAPPLPAERTLETVAVGPQGVRRLEARPDGGHLVEAETGTVAYRGAATAQFLGRPRTFERETEIVVPEGCQAKVTVDGETCEISEPGVVLIGAGREACVEVHGGEPLVVCSERAPAWYRKHLPHEPLYQDLARRNQHLVDGRTTLCTSFPAGLLNRLAEGGVVAREPDGVRVRWPEGLRTHEALDERLRGLDLPEKETREVHQIWEDTLRRRLLGFHCGRLPRAHFTEDEVGRLVAAGLFRESQISPGELFWTRYHAEDELRGRLNQAGFAGAAAEKVVDAWRHTSRAGYDATGLTWHKDGVTLYTHRGRLNMWNEQPTEWLVASTSYSDGNRPFTVGVSTVRSPWFLGQPIPFRDLRPAENLHRHPVSEGASQTEAYLVSRGKGALLTVDDGGRAFLHLLHAGDMTVVEPGQMHAMLAADGNFEQLVFQVPSTFQYGFRFKESVDYRDRGLDYHHLVGRACRELAAGTRGAVEVTPRTGADRSPDVLTEGL